MDYDALPEAALPDDVREKIDRAIEDLRGRSPFWAALADQHVVGGIGDFGTVALRRDGALLLTPAYVGLVSVRDLGVELALKALYRVADVFDRRGDRNHQAWNMAVQHAGIDVLRGTGLPVPEILEDEGVYFRDLEGKTAEELYEMLPERIEPLRRALEMAKQAESGDVPTDPRPGASAAAPAPGRTVETEVQVAPVGDMLSAAWAEVDGDVPDAFVEWARERGVPLPDPRSRTR